MPCGQKDPEMQEGTDPPLHSYIPSVSLLYYLVFNKAMFEYPVLSGIYRPET